MSAYIYGPREKTILLISFPVSVGRDHPWHKKYGTEALMHQRVAEYKHFKTLFPPNRTEYLGLLGGPTFISLPKHYMKTGNYDWVVINCNNGNGEIRTFEGHTITLDELKTFIKTMFDMGISVAVIGGFGIV